MRKQLAVLSIGAVVAGLLLAIPVSSASATTAGLAFSADALPTWQTNNVVYGMASSHGKIVVGGSFSQIRPGAGQSGAAMNEAGIAILGASTGTPDSCQLPAALSGGTPTIYAVEAAPDGNTVFVGGNFSSIGGVSVSRLAEINVVTCKVTSFRAGSISSLVYAIAPTADAVYFGGAFQTVAGQSRPSIAKVSRTGTLDPNWVVNVLGTTASQGDSTILPNAASKVRAIAVSPDGAKIALGGDFFSINGQSTHSIGVVDGSTGSVLASYPSLVPNTSITKVIRSDSTSFYVGNEGTGGGIFDGTLAVDWSTLTQRWRDNCLGATQALLINQGNLYEASHHHDCSSMGEYPDGRRNYLEVTRTDDVTQHQQAWYPTLNDGTGEGIGPRAFALDSTGTSPYLWVGGEFTLVNLASQQGLTRFGTTDTGNPPTPSVQVKALAPNSVQVRIHSVFDSDDGDLTYSVYRNASTTPIWTGVGHSQWWYGTQLTFTDTTVTAGTSYKYQVRATDAAGNQSGLSSAQNVTPSSTGSAYAQTVINDGPRMYYRYDDPTSTSTWAVDSSGTPTTGLYGTAAHAVTRDSSGAIAGDPSLSATFNGTNQYIWNDNYAPGPSTYTLETWFNTTDTTSSSLIGYGNGRPRTDNGNDTLSSNYDRILYLDGNGKANFGVYDNGTKVVSSAKAYNDGTWHYAAATQGANGMKLYIDGLLVAQNNITTNQQFSGIWHVGGDNLNSWPGVSGANNAQFYYAGQLDETAIYYSALTKQQVLAHFQAGGGTPNINAAPADAYGKAVYNDGADDFWRFDEASGNTADASMIGGNPGTVGSAVTRSAGGINASGNTITLPGSNSNGEGIVVSPQTAAPSAFTAETWIKTSTTNGGKILGFEDTAGTTGSNYDHMIYMANNGQLLFGVYTGSTQTIQTPVSYNDNKWHHVVATEDAGGMKLYVDGTLVGTNPTTTNQSYQGYWRLGGGNLNGWPSQPSSQYFAGQADDVAIYSFGLSASAVQNHYALGVQDHTAPTTPTGLGVTPGSTVNLSWLASTDDNSVAGYKVYRGASASTLALAATVTTTSWTDPDTTPGTRFYSVSAVDGAGNESAQTAPLQVTQADTSAPTAPSGLAVSVAGPDASLTWTASTDNVGVTQYSVSRGTSPGSLSVIGTSVTAGYSDPGLANGTYYYSVVASDAAGNVSPASATASGVVNVDNQAPTVPAGLTATPNNAAGSVALSWSAATDNVGVGGYRVYRGTTPGFAADSSSLLTTTTSLTYTDAAVAPGTWYYEVAAFDTTGNQSAASAAVSAVVVFVDTAAPSVPAGVTATGASDGSASVTWTPSTDNVGVAGYRVYRSTSSGFVPGASTLVATVSAASFQDAGLAVGTYYYKVVAFDAAGNSSSPSAQASAVISTAPDTTPPSVPTGVTAAAAGTTINVAWTASTDNVGVTGYQIYRGSSAAFVPGASSLVATVTTTTYANTGLAAGTYFYKVIAVDAAANASGASTAASATIVGSTTTQVITVPVSLDTMVAQTNANFVYGTQNQLSAKGGAGSEIDSYLRFTLPAAPSGLTLTGATLQIRTSNDPTAATVDPTLVQLLTTSAWDETTTTWNTRPLSAIGAQVGQLTSAPSLNTAYTVTLDASQLAAYLAGDLNLVLTGSSADNLRVSSKDSTTASYRPTLVLTFS